MNFEILPTKVTHYNNQIAKVKNKNKINKIQSKIALSEPSSPTTASSRYPEAPKE